MSSLGFNNSKGIFKNSPLDYPKIRKAIFIVDKDRRYAFDVNQNITIANLKKMIIAAADLGKGLKLYHEGIEYTHNDADSLDFLFPTLDVVVFDLSVSYDSVDELDELIKLKLSYKYCPIHYSKYPYFYCYNCGKSICSECVKSGAHDGHDFKEKYDYLQSSHNLVQQLFKNLNDGVTKVDEKYLLELKDKITFKYFDPLVKMIKAIEAKLIQLIDEFVRRNKSNIDIVRKNMTDLRNNIEEGLDELKDKISIEDMMLDEEIFLTFDRKYKDIASEKNKILGDIEAYNQFKSQLKILGDSVEKIYYEIYAFLDKYLTSDIYNNISKEIECVDIIPVSKKEIMQALLSDIKKKPKLFRSVKKTNPYYDNEGL